MTERNSKTSPPEIEFKPTNEKEQAHLERLNALLMNKRRGDWGLVGEIIGCEAQTAEKSFKRVYSKNHAAAVDALEQVINTRTQLLNN